ncbi:exopolysaccharide biosynthesis protein [Actinophytocola sp.]|uniref:exopolysaccharide biosynthesis protein n=1 Tax=Actinophytocola sp. TaxID=1872138 RepID=UPI003D6C24DB
MNDDTVRLSMVGQVFRRRRRLLIVFTIVGAAVGVAASLLFSPGYAASANVLLQGPREPDQLVTEAQVAMSSAVLDDVATELNWGKSARDLADSVDAVVAEGNIIKVTGYADTPERAQRLADQVANEFVGFSTRLLSDTADPATQVSQEQQKSLRQQVVDTNRLISELHDSAGGGNTIDSVGVRTELEALRNTLAEAMTRIDELDAAAGQGKIVVMAPADRPTGPAAPSMLHFVAGGAALFLLLGVLGHLYLARSDRRMRREEHIASAIGSPLLGGIDVPDEPDTDRPAGDRRERLRRLLVDDRPWHIPELPTAVDEEGLEIRYRRVLSRLRERVPRAAATSPVLVVVAKDDPSARRAAARLARTATDTATDTVGRERLDVVAVSAEQPIVPDGAAGVLVVITAGTRTPWELVDIAEACTDAGHGLLGVLVTHRTRPKQPTRPAETPPDVPAETAMAGSA